MRFITKRPASPCYQCPDREVGCHSVCEKYKTYEKENMEYRQAVYNEKRKEYAYLDVDRMFEARAKKKRKR
jgi:hypothetical protein